MDGVLALRFWGGIFVLVLVLAWFEVRNQEVLIGTLRPISCLSASR
jgi:hypothetical protein